MKHTTLSALSRAGGNMLRALSRQLVPNMGTLVLVALLLFAYNVWAAPQAAPPAQGTTTGLLSYQGYLTDAGGSPLDGGVGITFRLYSAPTSGTALWTEAHTGGNAVPVSDGLFNVLLGSLTPIPSSVWSNDILYLGVQVGNDTEMTPRENLGAVPYAKVAGELAGPAKFGGHFHSYPYIMGLSEFLRHQSFFCYGLVPTESDGTHTCSLEVLHNFFDVKSLMHSTSGSVRTTVNSPDSPRWGHSFAFFLSNPGSATSLNISFGTSNDVAIYVISGSVTGDSLGDSGTMVYHRTPGTSDGGEGCPCATITPNIPVPSGDFRLVILTRGGDCTSYITWPSSKTNWIVENGLEIDWSNLRTYLGEY